MPAKKGTKEQMPDWSQYRGILVFVEQRNRVPKSVSWQLLGIGKKMATKLKAPLIALVIGDQVGEIAQEANAPGKARGYADVGTVVWMIEPLDGV